MNEQKKQEPTARRGHGQRVLILVLVGLLAVASLTAWGLWATRTPRARVTRERVTPEWVTPAARGVRNVAIVALALGALAVAYQLGKTVYDDVHERWVKARQDRATIVDLEQQVKLSNVRTLKPDRSGRLGVAYDGTTFRDMDNLRTYTQLTTVYLAPMLEKVDAIHRLVTAGGWPAASTQGQLLEPGPAMQAATLGPSTLGTLLDKYHFAPRLHQVLIGEYIDDQGKAQPLTLDIPKSVHVLCTGASGLGKSTLLETIALQLAGLQGVQLAAIDYGSGTFDGLEDALHWQLADSPSLALALFHELIKLYRERRELYGKVGRVRSLDQYNAATGDGLPFVACFVDETSALLEHDGTKEPLIELARVGRKYGLGLILGGTDFKASTLPSEARSNCLARLAFWLEPGLSQSLLNNRAASDDGMDVGDIVAKKPGTAGTIRGHTPEVTEASYRRLARRPGDAISLEAVTDPGPGKSNGNGHKPEPTLDDLDDPNLPEAERIRRLHAAGVSKRKIELHLFDYAGGAATVKVNAALSSSSSETEGDGDGTGGGEPLGSDGTTTTTVDFCDFCDLTLDNTTLTTFAECPSCGVAVCSECATEGLCPDCQKGA